MDGPFSLSVHPGRSTWNQKITKLKRKIIFQTIILTRFHVNLPGCNPPPPQKKKYPILSHRCPPHLPMSSARIIALHRAAHLSETEVGWRNREILGTKKNGWVVFCLGPGVIFVCFFWKTNKHKGLPTHIWFTCVCCLVILELWLLSLLVEASNSFKIWGWMLRPLSSHFVWILGLRTKIKKPPN